MMLDFRVAVLSDGTATLSDEEHQAALNVLIQEFADVLTVDEVLGELAGQCDHCRPLTRTRSRHGNDRGPQLYAP